MFHRALLLKLEKLHSTLLVVQIIISIILLIMSSSFHVIRDEVEDVAFENDASFGIDAKDDPRVVPQQWPAFPSTALPDVVAQQLIRIVQQHAQKDTAA